ncbi:MAG: peptidylprolyl isomerase [Planctomycetota bacterium]
MARTDAGADAPLSDSSRKPNRWVLIGSAAAVVAVCVVIKSFDTAADATAQSVRNTPATQPVRQASAQALTLPADPPHDIMAIVNGQEINRTQLAQACIERHGEDVLESLVNKRLIQHRCANRGISVTAKDLEAEVDRIAARFKLDRDQWLSLLEKERGIKAEEYKRDILWPTIALRRLAGKEIRVTDEEIGRAFGTRYGPSVQVRLIVVSDGKRAVELQKIVAARPDDFARVAMQNSEDVNSASIGGLIQPVRLHTGDPLIEQAAFALEPGQVSAVIQVENQFAIIKCEKQFPERNVKLEEVRASLVEAIKEEKLRGVAAKVFEEVQTTATVVNVYNTPELRARMPGVVATVNGEQIPMHELGKECLARHGGVVLEGEITRLLLQQELKRASVVVSEADLHQEMAHAATLAGVVDPQGNPDMPKWVKTNTEEADVSYEVYLRDSVWPSAALKKLTTGEVEVTEEDLKMGFEANYGQRVRVRAIVLPSMRRAQEVWAKARENVTLEYFGELAAEYSIEPTSKTLRGEVPPLRQHGGQPQLEKAAFALQDGEMSGIVQVGDKFVILRCEGRTQPVEVDMATVAPILRGDLFEKKLRMAMAERFKKIRERGRIDNYLAGTSQAPPAKTAGPRRDTAVRPTAGTR